MKMGMLGQKRGMSQFFDSLGRCIPVTIISSDSCVVAGKRTLENDGYTALILGYGERKVKRPKGGEESLPSPRPIFGQFRKSGLKPARILREIRVDQETLDRFETGESLKVSLFREGEVVDITGISRGKGFTGVMKRWNFSGMPASRGTHEYFRHGGSIGTNLTPGRTLRGKKMAGHSGNARVTVQNLKVIRVDEENDLLYIKGGVPGPNRGYLLIRGAVKAR